MASFYVESETKSNSAKKQPMTVEQAKRVLQTELASKAGETALRSARAVPAGAIMWGESNKTASKTELPTPEA